MLADVLKPQAAFRDLSDTVFRGTTAFCGLSESIKPPATSERVWGPWVGETSVYGGVLDMHGNLYLSMDIATESEVADTKGSTATGAPL